LKTFEEDTKDIVIVGKGKALNGDTVYLYYYKDQPDLKRITTSDKPLNTITNIED